MPIALRCLSWFPLRLLQALGALLGWLVYVASATYRRRFREQAQWAGVPWSQARAAIAGAGQMVLELPWVWLRPWPEQATLVQWQDEAVLTAALAKGRGAILMTPHMGSFELIPQAQMQRFGAAQGPMMALYRPARQAWVDRWLLIGRRRTGMELAPASTAGVRQLLKALRQGRVIGMLPDQVPPDGLGVWAPFFGRPAYTMTLALRLAEQTGAPLVLTWCERLHHGRGFVIHARALELPAGLSTDGAATALNAALDAVIRQQPGMYLWGYARYKQPRKEG